MKFLVRIKKDWADQKEKGMNVALFEMATDIHKRSLILAPKLSYALINSSRIVSIPEGYKITYGNARVPYARRRHYENKKNPQTIGYLAKAGDSVARGDKSKYFRNKV